MVSGIIEDVRDFLGDPDGTRWTDRQLIKLIDQAQKDIALKALALRGQFNLGITDDQVLYKLPDDVQLISRVVDEEPIPLVSHEDMDDKVYNWRTATGSTVQAVVYTKFTENYIRPYPTITGVNETAYDTDDLYGFSTDLGVTFFGLITDVEDAVEVIGYATDLSEVYGADTVDLFGIGVL